WLATGAPSGSVKRTTSGFGSSDPARADCSSPEMIDMLATSAPVGCTGPAWSAHATASTTASNGDSLVACFELSIVLRLLPSYRTSREYGIALTADTCNSLRQIPLRAIGANARNGAT